VAITSKSPRRQFRLSLRTLLVVFACLAVGLTISPGSMTDMLQSAVAAAMVLGLAQEVVAIVHQTRRLCTSSVGFAILWRLGAAAILTTRLSLGLLSINGNDVREALGFSTFQLYDPVQLPFLLTMTTVILSSIGKWASPAAGGARRYAILAVFGTGVSIVALHESGFLYHLVYRALEGIEQSEPLKFQRAGAYPNHAAEGHWFFWTSVLAVGAVFVSALALLAMSRTSPRLWSLTILACCQALLIVFGGWYYRSALVRISPEFAEAGIQASLADWCFGASLFAMAALAAAYRLTRGEVLEQVSYGGSIHESPTVLSMLLGAAIAFPVETTIHSLDTASGGFWQQVSDVVSYYVQDPWMYLQLAVCAAAFRLAFLRWHWWGEQPPLAIHAIRPARMAIVLAGLTMLAATGIPALSAFSFASWFSPWST
jgi:hypothetical protein